MNTKMKTKLKTVITLVLIFAMSFNMNILKPKAADVSISIALSASNVSVGSGVTATINVSGGSISAYTMYVSYNAGVLQYNSGSGATVNGGGGTVVISGTSSGSISLSFTAIANGSSSISTSGSDFFNIDGNALSVSHAGVTVNVATAQSDNPTGGNNNSDGDNTTTETTEEDNRSDNCKLSGLQISPGTLEPAFSPDVTSYFVQVEKDVTSMVVSATPADSKATTQIWGAGLIEPGENTVKITVTAENGAVKVYNLRVVAGEELGDANVTIDDVFYKFADNQNVDGIPDGFNPVTITYKDWEVLAFESPNKEIKVVCLIDVEDNFSWYIYDAEADIFAPYKEYSSKYNRYIILSKPDDVILPDDFLKVELDIDGNIVEAYKSDRLNDNQLYLVYAMNIEGGEALYIYDKAEGTFMRYVPPVEEETEEIIATPTEVATSTDIVPPSPVAPKDNTMLYIAIAAGGLALLFLVLFCVMLGKHKNMKEKAQKAEDMVQSLGGGRGVDRSVLNNSSTIDLEALKASEAKKEESEQEGVIELPRGKNKNNKNTSFVETLNNIEPISLDAAPKDDISQIPNVELDIATYADSESKAGGGAFDIGYRPDEKELQFDEYAHESELINNKIRDNYDADQDSAFGLDQKIDDTDK